MYFNQLPLNRILVVVLLLIIPGENAWSSSYKVLYNFNYTSANPYALISDAAGNAYGVGGGQDGFGTIYELSPTAGYHLLYAFHFGGVGGKGPVGSLVLDSAGNLYGATSSGGNHNAICGSSGCGVVYKLSPSSNGGLWTETVLYSFCSQPNCADGWFPVAGVIFDSAGNLYGTTQAGGLGCGTVFELTPTGANWNEQVLHSVSEGCFPSAGLTFDGAGNLYGTVSSSGPGGGGLVFELSPNARGAWTYADLYAFGSSGSQDAAGPESTLVFDSAGNLYGTTLGGGQFGSGTVFRLAADAGAWTEAVLHSFGNGNDGAIPVTGLVLDASGNLYGTTVGGGDPGCGSSGCGTVYTLSPTEGGGWFERVFRFPADGQLGLEPYSSVVLDSAGNVFGTAKTGGANNDGVVFKITP